MKKYFLYCLLCFCSPVFSSSDVTKVQHIPVMQAASSWDGSPLPAYPNGQPEISIFKGIIPPGAKSPVHLHPTIGSYYIVRGELTVTTMDNKVLHAKAGNAYNEVVDQWHYGVNNGTEPVEIIFFNAGVKGVLNTRLEEKGSMMKSNLRSEQAPN